MAFGTEEEKVEQQGLMADMMGGGAEEQDQLDPVEPVESEPVEPVEPVAVDPVAVAPVTPVVETSAEPTLEQTNEELRRQLMELTAKLQQVPTPTQVFPSPNVEPAAPAATQQSQQPSPVTPTQPAQTQTYLTEDELDQIIDNPKLILTAIQRAQQDIVTQFAANIPAIISQQVSQQVNQQVLVQKAVTEFYDGNSDLRPYAQFVQFVMGEIETTHKDKTYAEIFEMTANESRKRLGLKNPGATPPQRDQATTTQKPAFAGSRRSGTARPTGGKEWFDENAADMLR